MDLSYMDHHFRDGSDDVIHQDLFCFEPMEAFLLPPFPPIDDISNTSTAVVSDFNGNPCFDCDWNGSGVDMDADIPALDGDDLDPIEESTQCQSLQLSAHRPIIVSIPSQMLASFNKQASRNDPMDVVQPCDTCSPIRRQKRSRELEDDGPPTKRRIYATDFNASEDAFFLREYLNPEGFPEDITPLKASIQSQFMAKAVEHCHFDLGWEQVRIRVAIQCLFNIKESNAKSRVCKIIKGAKKSREASTNVNVNKRSHECIDPNLDADEITDDQADGPPFKKQRTDD